MKDIITSRLQKISSLNDRKLLKDVLRDVYENLAEYNLSMYDRLENRLYNEIESHIDDFAIYTSAEYAENIDPISEFLHPMVPNDTEAVLNLAEIGESLNAQPNSPGSLNPVIASVFMKCSNSEISRLLSENKVFKGILKTDKGTSEISVKVKRCNKYINQIDRLYKAFQRNNIVWATVNCPYAYKFIDIILATSVSLSKGETINEITLDLGEYDKYKQINVVPVWNVKRLEIDENSFPMPAIDRANYEHRLALESFGAKNGYLVALDNADFTYTIRRETELIVVSESSAQQPWKLLQVESPPDVIRRNNSFEVFSNKRDMGFAGRYAAIKSLVIRTKGELGRVLNSYEQSKSILFQGVEILESYKKTRETIDFNPFIDDNIRTNTNKKVMLLRFKAGDGEQYLVHDKISFLVSEVQILFPDYDCVGELMI